MFDTESAHDLYERLLRSEALNAELARMLKKHEWVEHEWADGWEWCPERDASYLCFETKREHKPDCTLAVLLKKAVTE